MQPERTFINTVIPEYVDLTYEVVIWTDFVEHMNSIVESVLYSEGTYWGEPERFKFRTKIDDFTNTTDTLTDSDRVVRTTFTLTLFGYIVPDVLVKHLSDHLSNKTTSVQQLNTILEVDADDSVFSETQTTGLGTSIQTPTVPNEAAPNPVAGGLDPLILTYLNTNTSLLATNVANFQFFVNGQLVEPAAIVTFIDNGDNTTTLTIDTGELGFTLVGSDEIIGVGKFNI